MAAPEVGRLYQGVAKESAAFKLMKSMGWEEGEGLGKNKQGISTHVRVVKKFDNTGIGIAEARKEASNWSVNTAVFDAILKNLNVKANEQSLQSAEEPTDAKDAMLPKPGAVESKGQKEPPATGERQPLKTARPQGRYKKREAGKCVKSYSESDLSAILGVAHATVAPKPTQSSTASAAPAFAAIAEAEEELEEAAEKTKKGKKDRAGKKGKKGKGEGIEEGPKKSKTPKMKHSQSESALTTSAQPTKESSPPPAEAVPRELPADWWGHRSGFVAGGVLGSASERKVKERAPGFSEADQEGLYHLVNNTATSGKKGLGTGSMPKKVAGARWKGQKVTFDEVEEGSDCGEDRDGEAAEGAEESRDRAGGDEASSDSGAKRGEKGKKKRKREEEDAEDGGAQGIKWKKILLDVLKKDGPSLQLEILLRRAVRTACKLYGGKEEQEAKLAKRAQAKVNALEGKCIILENGVVRIK